MHRIRFEKTGRAVWMSHLDLMRLMQRAFRRAGVVLHHSQGFTPHAYVSMLLPLSVGMESVCELMEYELDGELAVTPEALNAVLPEGVRVLEVYQSTRKARELRRLRALLTGVAQAGRAIEVNTWCGRTVTQWQPLLELYRDCGGELITLGSDAHRPEDVGKGIAQAQELLRTVGFRYFTVYHRRTPQFIRL